MHRGKALVSGAAMIAAALLTPGSAQADVQGDVQAAGCTIQSYSSGGFVLSHKGKGDPNYDYGNTTFHGRTMHLRTSSDLDRSAGSIISGWKSGDRMWVDISGNGGKSWQQCGVTGTSQTSWFQHGTVANRWIRVCIKVKTGQVGCAHVGNKTGPGSRKWWSD